MIGYKGAMSCHEVVAGGHGKMRLRRLKCLPFLDDRYYSTLALAFADLQEL